MDALAPTAAAPAAAPAPDPIAALVPKAFALGWRMAGIYRAQFEPRQPWPDAPARLPTLARFPADQRVGLGLNEVEASIARLAAALTAIGLKVPSGDRLRTLYEDVTTTPGEGHAAMYVLHVQLMQALTAADFRLGAAYGLGRALADSCWPPQDGASLARAFTPRRLTNLRAWLNDCSSALPEHSAHGVLQSLTRWEAYAANVADPPPDDPPWETRTRTVAGVLERQGEMWRSIMSGDKRATDMLNSDDYRAAAGSLLAGARVSIALALLPVAIPALIVAAIVVVLVLFVISSGTAQLVAIVTAAGGFLGVTWNSALTVMRKLTSWVEKPLWGAEVNAAVADALTYLPPRPAGCDQLLTQTPRCLRALKQPRTLPELTQRLRRLRLPSKAPTQPAVRYWLVWAIASGYVVRGEGDTYHLADEGRRLAAIPPRHRGAALAAVTAARPSALSDQPAEEAEAA